MLKNILKSISCYISNISFHQNKIIKVFISFSEEGGKEYLYNAHQTKSKNVILKKICVVLRQFFTEELEPFS